jgi:hypothetical protein
MGNGSLRNEIRQQSIEKDTPTGMFILDSSQSVFDEPLARSLTSLRPISFQRFSEPQDANGEKGGRNYRHGQEFRAGD